MTVSPVSRPKVNEFPGPEKATKDSLERSIPYLE